MMYHACTRPGRKPRHSSARLISESALQTPRLTHTGKALPSAKEGLWFYNGGTRGAVGDEGRGDAGGEKCVPAIGGKRMARRKRKQSVPHMVIAARVLFAVCTVSKEGCVYLLLRKEGTMVLSS